MIDKIVNFIHAYQAHIQSILFFVVLHLYMLIGAELLELANLPILCDIGFLCPSSEHCGTLYRLCKGF